MKATLCGCVVAESDEIVEHGGYAYFPREAVRMEWLEPAERDRKSTRLNSSHRL